MTENRTAGSVGLIPPSHKQCVLCGGIFPPGAHECVQKRPEVRLNADGTLDEVVAFGAYVHLEQMSAGDWWLGIESGGHLIHVNLGTKRGAIGAIVNDPA